MSKQERKAPISTMEQVADHLHGREPVGTTVLRNEFTDRAVHIWTVPVGEAEDEEAERILIYQEKRKFRRWETSQQDLSALRSQAIAWLAETSRT